MFRKPVWSPYIAGIIIGLLQIPAFMIVNTGLGTSSSFVKISGHILSLFQYDASSHPYFGSYVTDPKDWWQLFLVMGIFLGALMSSAAGGLRRDTPSPVWQQDFHLNDRQRYMLAFIGGFVLLFGARLAGGCTSGHGLTGVGQLSISSILSVTGMFAGGIGFALLWRYFVNRCYYKGDE